MNKKYLLFIDDERSFTDKFVVDNYSHLYPKDIEVYTARTAQQAIQIVEKLGMCSFVSYDHDLGILANLLDKDENIEYYVDHTVMTFLKWLSKTYWHPGMPIPEYAIHSANPIGRANIKAFMDSWARSTII